jgi:hypothetical protein
MRKTRLSGEDVPVGIREREQLKLRNLLASYIDVEKLDTRLLTKRSVASQVEVSDVKTQMQTQLEKQLQLQRRQVEAQRAFYESLSKLLEKELTQVCAHGQSSVVADVGAGWSERT